MLGSKILPERRSRARAQPLSSSWHRCKKKNHVFDLGCSSRKWVVECKSHRWTTGHNVPSAKLTVWNEAIFYFCAAPLDYKKVLFVLRDLRRGSGESLATYYLRTYEHLVPEGVEIWEYDESKHVALQVGT